jgi:arylsulfatase A-like enzyme
MSKSVGKKPNILLITADQLRPDALGCYGNKVCRTPHLDSIASGGVIFDKAYTPNPVCVPARASITCGAHSLTCTMYQGGGGPIKADQTKLAEHFRSFGYGAYACGKLHYAHYSPPDKPRLVHGFETWDSHESGRIIYQFDRKNALRGVEDYMDFLTDAGWKGFSRAHGIGNNDIRPCPSPLPEELCPDHWVADRTIARIEEHRKNRPDNPFLVWCSFPKPHSPYDPPLPWATMYNPKDVPPPAGDESMIMDRNPAMQRERIRRAMDTISPEARLVIKAYYYGLISFQDFQVGRVLAALKRMGVSDDTIIIYTADHGDMMGDFGTWFKGLALEGSCHLPFLVKGPGVPAGQRRRQLAGLQDVLPTLAGLTGCPLKRPLDGADLTAPLKDAKAPIREGSGYVRDLYYSNYGQKEWNFAMVTDGRWKYCYAEQGPTEELYDLDSDPAELVNLASKPGNAGLVASWREKLIGQARRLGHTNILKGDGGLTSFPCDRAAIDKMPITEMGWRWY